MKKVGLFFIFSFLFSFSSFTQEDNSVRKNVFLGLGGQGNVYTNNDAHDFETWTKPSLGGNLFLGKWFSSKVGGRIFIEGGSLHPFFHDRKVMVHEKYGIGRLDFLLNLTNLFREYKPDRFYNLVPYVGIGGGYTFNAVNRPDNKKDFTSLAVGAGLLNTFRLSDVVSIYLNLGINGVDAKFDGYKGKNPNVNLVKEDKFNFISSGALGLIFNFGKSAPKEIIAPPVVEEPAPQPAPAPTPAPTPPPAPAPTPAPTPAPAPAPFLENVFFRLDKSVIDVSEQVAIERAVSFLRSNPGAKLRVIGHADVQTANPKYNLGLSERRAKAVARELVNKYNISSDRLIIDWKGDTVQPFNINERNRVVILTE